MCQVDIVGTQTYVTMENHFAFRKYTQIEISFHETSGGNTWDKYSLLFHY